MKRLQLEKALSTTDYANGAIVTRTKRMMRNALLVAARKNGPVDPRTIITIEHDEDIPGGGEMHVILMRIDVP